MAKTRATNTLSARPSPVGSSRTLPPAPKPAPRLPLWAWLGILAVVASAIYARALAYPFLSWDDQMMVSQDPWLHPVTFSNVIHFWRHSYYGLYVPLTYNIYALVALLSHALHAGQGEGLSPSVFHFANLILHVGATWTLFFLLRKLDLADIGAFMGAAFFAVHPLMVDAVAWIGGMDTVLSTLLAFLSLIAYVTYAKQSTGPSPTGRRWLYFGVASLFYILALLAKPSVTCLPVMAAALDIFVFRRRLRDFAPPLLAWLVVAAGWIHLTQGSQFVVPSAVAPFWQRPFVAGDAIAFYLVKLILPFRLALDYGRSATLVTHEAWGYVTWLFPAALALVSWRIFPKFRWLGIGFAMMVAGLLPMLGLVPFGFQEYSTVADRYLYLGMLGPAIVVAGLVTVQHKKPVTVALIAVLVVYGVQSAFQVGTWRNAVTLFSHSLSINPNSGHVEELLGDVYAGRSDPADALIHYEASARLEPTYGLANSNAASALALAGDTAQAIPYFERAIADDPSLVKAHFGLGLAYAETGRLPEAAEQWQAAVQLAPNVADYRYNLGVALFRLGRFDEAAEQFRADLAMRPGDESAERWLAAITQAQARAPRSNGGE